MGYADRWEHHHTLPSKISRVPKPKPKPNLQNQKEVPKTGQCIIKSQNEISLQQPHPPLPPPSPREMTNKENIPTLSSHIQTQKPCEIASRENDQKCKSQNNEEVQSLSMKKINASVNSSAEDIHLSIGLDETEAMTIHTQYIYYKHSFSFYYLSS
jgi:hypothetical protein